MIIIGIDPDSSKHGVAVYENRALISLNNWDLITIYQFIEMSECELDEIEFHIEDVCANNASFHAGKAKNKSTAKEIGRRIGMVQQAQTELERVLNYFGVKVVKHKISKMWKDQNGKKQFEQVTGWTKRSNEDTRSAAYFGFIGHKNGITKIN